MLSTPHLFSLYVGNTLEKKHYAPDTLITIRSAELARRIFTILRLSTSEQIQLFSETCVLIIALEPSPHPKDTIVGRVIDCTAITPAPHQQIACIGLLKKESFEEAVHHATVTGATHIVPLVTTKSRKGWLNPREAERLTTIMIAACEQSKNYRIPILASPQKLDGVLRTSTNTLSIGFESTGVPFSDIIKIISHSTGSTVQFFIGPEGGFTQAEYFLMQSAGVSFYQLTSTILRSQEAVCLAGGLISALKSTATRSS